MHCPFTQCRFAGQALSEVPHTHVLLGPQRSLTAVTQLKQPTPPRPQLVGVFARHMPPLQQPIVHVCAVQPTAHGPPSQPQVPAVHV